MIISERVIAESDDERIVCWLLTRYGYRQNAIYRLTAEQCNADRINAIHLRPVATLVEVRRGSVGWFDAVSSYDRQTAAPGPSDEDQEQGRTPITDDDDDADNDWSFLDENTVINVYNEPYIATDLDKDENTDQSSGTATNNRQPHTYSSVTAIACISVLLAL